MEKSEFWVPIGAILAATAIFIALGLKDFGSTVVIFTMIMAIIWLGGVNLKQLAILLGAGLLAAGFLIVV